MKYTSPPLVAGIFMRVRMGGMDALKAGDWVQTKEGHEGEIVLVARQTAFIAITGHDEMRTKPHLLNELTKVDPPTKSDKRFRPE
jgi:hypothetical protein